MSRLFSILPALALFAMAAPAAQAQPIAYRLSGAVMTTQGVSQDPGLSHNELMVATFDGNDQVSFDPTHSFGFGLHTGNHAGIALAPSADKSQYAAIGAGGQMAFDLRQFHTDDTQLAGISVNVGSIDSYNYVEILGLTSAGDLDYDHPLFTLDGSAIAAAGGRDGRLTFGFDDSVLVGGILFGSTGVAFEFDSLAVSLDTPRPTNLAPTAVPEPSSWALLVAGFGALGGTMRRRRHRAGLFSASDKRAPAPRERS